MPRRDLFAPTDDGPAEGTDLDRTRLVLQVAAETIDERDGEVGIVMVIDAAHDFLSVNRP